jgi:transcriptional regulator with XRE-family HTH domain
MTISEQLRDAIKRSGLSLNQIANLTGLGQPALWRFVSDDPDTHRDIRLERTADKLAAFFKLGLALLPEKTKTKPKAKLPTVSRPRRPTKKRTRE